MAESFDDVFAAELEPVHRYLARRFGNALADDLATETFAIAFRRWGDLDPSRPARPWLYGIAANVARHHRRKEQRMLRAYARAGVTPTVDENDLLGDRLESETAEHALAEALAALRPSEREVLLLNAWAELTDSEIADALSLPVGTVKSRLSRAHQHLRRHLSGIGQVEVETG